LQTSFIDTRRNSAIPSEYFPDVCTIQELTTTTSLEGEVEEAWSDLDGHSSIRCSVNPPNDMHEVKTKDLTYSMASHDISLNGFYPLITASMRAVVKDVPYDILVPKHSGHSTTTLLKCRVVG